MNIWTHVKRWWTDSTDQRLQRFCRMPSLADSELTYASNPEVEVFRDGKGDVRHVRIGSWRVVAASRTRRIVEVRQLEGCRRVALRIELHDQQTRTPTCTIWELYDMHGSLLAMLQSSQQQDFWLSTDFQTGRILRSDSERPTSLSA